MERSLSVLLPVHNSQSTLASQVEEILDVLTELTSSFELVIIDDGSSDATIEVADELASRYPQVRAVRHGVSLGRPAAVQTGLQESTGEIICLHDEGTGLPIDEVHKLWHTLEEGSRGAGQPAKRRRASRSPVAQSVGGGYQVCHRESLAPGKHAAPLDGEGRDGRPRRPNFFGKTERAPHQDERS